MNKLSTQPLVMHPKAIREMVSAVQIGLKQFNGDLAQLREQIEAAEVRRFGEDREEVPETVVLQLHGMIEYRMSLWGWFFDGSSVRTFGKMFQNAVDDSRIKKIVIDVDSPGGQYPGIPELSKQIFDQRDAKGNNGIVAIANPQAASGAVWIATAAQKFYTLGSGSTGSIGTFSVHTEFSRLEDEAGITRTVIRDPEGKAEWNPWEPLSDKAQEHEQELVSAITSEFQAAVAKHRGVSLSTVRNDFGQGRELDAKQAVSVGLVDGVRTLERLVSPGKPSRHKASMMSRRAKLRANRLTGSPEVA